MKDKRLKKLLDKYKGQEEFEKAQKEGKKMVSDAKRTGKKYGKKAKEKVQEVIEPEPSAQEEDEEEDDEEEEEPEIKKKAETTITYEALNDNALFRNELLLRLDFLNQEIRKVRTELTGEDEDEEEED